MPIRSRLRWVVLAAAVAAAATVLPALPAAADSGSGTGDVQVAQTLDGQELTVVLRRVTSVPGPLAVDVLAHQGGRLRTVRLRLTGATAGPSRWTSIALHTPGSASTTLQVSFAGPWTLALATADETATIPFVVPAQALAPTDIAAYGGIALVGACLLGSFVVGVRAKRGFWTAIPLSGVGVGAAVAVTATVLSAVVPLPPQPGLQLDPTVQNVTSPYAVTGPRIADWSRPPVVLLAQASGTRVDLSLVDAPTGAPVDDLVVHDSAFIHLLAVGPDGTLRHVHPFRVSAGRYRVDLTGAVTGDWALSAELERRGGGVQLVRAATPVMIRGTTSSVAAAVPALRGSGAPVSTVTAGTRVRVAAVGLVAGRPTTLTASLPAADLQPWLGMVGHAIIAGPLTGAVTGDSVRSVPVWSHTHSMGAMPAATGSTAAGMAGMGGMTAATGGTTAGMGGLVAVNGDSVADESVAGYGPDVPFTFTFPTAGRYRVWIQVERSWRIIMIPFDVIVTGAAP